MRRVEIIGNIGKDGDLRQAGDTDVLNFRVAAKGGKKDDEAVWFGCALFGKRAAALAQYLKKGQRVFVRGELKLRAWEKGDKSGTDLDVNVDEIELLGDRNNDRNEAKSETSRAPLASDLPF